MSGVRSLRGEVCATVQQFLVDCGEVESLRGRLGLISEGPRESYSVC